MVLLLSIITKCGRGGRRSKIPKNFGMSLMYGPLCRKKHTGEASNNKQRKRSWGNECSISKTPHKMKNARFLQTSRKGQNRGGYFSYENSRLILISHFSGPNSMFFFKYHKFLNGKWDVSFQNPHFQLLTSHLSHPTSNFLLLTFIHFI